MRKEDTIFYTISLLVFIIFVSFYVDYRPKSKFSVFVVRKVEALKHLIFHNAEERQKKIKKLEEDIAAYKKEFADLKSNWHKETDDLEILTQNENEINENLQSLNVSLNDYFLEAENTYLYFKNERTPNIKNSSEKIIFFEDFLSLIKNDVKKEKSDLEEKLRSYEQKMEDTKLEIERINRLQNVGMEETKEKESSSEERNEELRIKEREYREMVRKIKDVKDALSTYDDKNVKIQRFEKIVNLMRDIFEKVKSAKISLKKLSLNIKDKKRAIENNEEKLKELSETIARDEEYLQELKS